MGLNPDFWRDRPVLVTGASGLPGSWLTRRRLEARAAVVCLVRDRVSRSELVHSHLWSSVNVVPGALRDGRLPRRTRACHREYLA